MEYPDDQRNKIIELNKIGRLISFIVAITVTYSLIKVYVYYVLLLHVPIFQYLDLTDLVFMGPTAIFWTLTISVTESVNYLQFSSEFRKREKYFLGILLYAFWGLFIWLGFRNDPIIQQIIWYTPKEYFWWGLIPLVIIVTLQVLDGGIIFFKKNRYVAIFIFAIWYGLFESFANYNILIKPVSALHYEIHTNSNEVIKTGEDLLFAGKIKNYWFIYDTKSQFVKAIRDDSVSTVNFDTKSLKLY